MYFEPAELPPLQMFYNAITFRLAIQDARPHIPAVLELIESGRIDPLAIDPQRVAWEDAADSLAEHRFKQIISRVSADANGSPG